MAAAAAVGVASEERPADAHRYVVIDGHKRITALQQLGRDKVEAVVWPMSDEEAVVLNRSLRLSEHETALAVGWLLAELEQRFGYGLDELARRFDRSVSWASRRLALVEALPEAIQRQVREGKIAAQVAMKFLVPAVRISLKACQRLASSPNITAMCAKPASCMPPGARHHRPSANAFSTRRICFSKRSDRLRRKLPPEPAPNYYATWKWLLLIVNRAHRRLTGAAAAVLDAQQGKAARYQIERIQKQLRRIDEAIPPEKDQHVEPSAAHQILELRHVGSEQTGDRTGDGSLPRGGAQGLALEVHRRYRNCNEPRRPNPTANRSWNSSTSAKGISCESMRNWWQRARSYRIRR